MPMIDTTSQQYQQGLNTLNQIIATYQPLFAKMRKLGPGQKASAKAWLQGDPIARKLLKIARELQPILARVEAARAEVAEELGE